MKIVGTSAVVPGGVPSALPSFTAEAATAIGRGPWRVRILALGLPDRDL